MEPINVDGEGVAEETVAKRFARLHPLPLSAYVVLGEHQGRPVHEACAALAQHRAGNPALENCRYYRGVEDFLVAAAVGTAAAPSALAGGALREVTPRGDWREAVLAPLVPLFDGLRLPSDRDQP